MTKLSRGGVFGCLLAVYSCISIAETVPINIEEVEASLREGNPRITLERYFNCGKYEGTGYESIARGSSRWIRLAEEMLQYSDACYTEGIQSSLGAAMQKAPKNVLPLVDKTSVLAADHICLPFISDEASIKLQLAELARSRKAIQRVHDPKFQTQKESCLRFIKFVQSNLTAHESGRAEKSSH
jgi:hypothetical protein